MEKAVIRRARQNLPRAVNKERAKSPIATCPASRHVHLMADGLRLRGEYLMLSEEPGHCAESLYAVLLSLWQARHRIMELERRFPDAECTMYQFDAESDGCAKCGRDALAHV